MYTLGMHKVVKSNDLYDATIRIQGKNETRDVRVNKLVLASVLPYFRVLLYECDNNGSDVYEIPEDNSDNLETLILVLTGERGESIDVTLESGIEILILFEKYGGSEYKHGGCSCWSTLVDIMKNSSDSIIKVYKLGWHAPIIKRAIKRVIAESTNRQFVYSIMQKIICENEFSDTDFRQFIYSHLEYRLVA